MVTIFRSRLRPEYEGEYYKWAERMEELARTVRGFNSIKTFYAKDGERVSIAEFETEEARNVWKNHPEHREAQRLGRERFYSEYTILVLNNPTGDTEKRGGNLKSNL